MHVTWLENEELFPLVTKKFEQTEVVLDIGCGIMPQTYVRPLVHICCEPFKQYVEHLQEKVKNEYDRCYVIINASWSEAVNMFPPKSVDTVFLVDVIEHLEKEEALALLKQTERIARKQIAIFTPLGFLPQHHSDGKDAWGLDGGAWQEHKSGWQPEDFDDTWEIYATRVFHTIDTLGREFETPYGAMWGVKTLVGFNGTDQKNLLIKNYIRAIVHEAIEIRVGYVLKIFVFLMKATLKIKRTPALKLLYKLRDKLNQL